MKRLLLCALLLTAGCETSNELGSCYGFVDGDKKDPRLEYEVPTRNIVFAAIFSASLLWPILTAAFWLHCPVRRIDAAGQK